MLSEHLLVVDDQEANRSFMEAALVAAGYSVKLAESGDAAMRFFSERIPDLILLDVMMPGCDGFETCRRIRETPGGREVPIVFVTALTDLGSHQRAMSSGADDFLAKPINRTELLLRVRSLLWIRRLRAELNSGYELIRSQRDALLTAQKQRETLTSLVVHDLKSPLTAILFNAEALAEECTAENAIAARQIMSAADSMHRMIMNLLDISRSEDGMLVPRLTRIDVGLLTRKIAHSHLLRDRHHTVTVDASDETVIDGDPELLRRLVENLLDNAKKYSPPGTAISLQVGPAGAGWVELRVEDRGAGIPAPLREKIFEKYFRLDATAAEQAGNSRGLGLTFCRLAAEVHGGRIWVDGGEGGGSCFHVRLPCSQALQGAAGASP